MNERRGRRMETRPGEEEAAGRWARGEVAAADEPTPALIGGLVLASGITQAECARQWGVAVTTLGRWREGSIAMPGRLAWWGLCWWARQTIPAWAGEQAAPRVGGDVPQG